MASIHRRPKSKYWYAAWRKADGKLKLVSTKQTGRKEAMVCAVAFEEAECAARQQALTESTVRDILADVLRRTGCEVRSPSVRAFLGEWLSGKAATTAVRSHERYASVVSAFLEHLGPFAEKPLTSLAPNHVQSFVTARRAAGVAPATVSIELAIVRSSLTRARKHGLITSNPAEAVDLPRADSSERGVFTEDEIRMLAAAATDEWKTLVLVGYYSGQRLRDCSGMRWSDVDLTAGTWTLRQEKTRKPLTIPLHPTLLAELERRATADCPEQFVMPTLANVGPGGRRGLSRQFLELCKQAGIDSGSVQGKGTRKFSTRSFHSLRHSFTSALANLGVAPELRMLLTGHSTGKSHAVYTHHQIESLRQAVSKLPSL
jgi:integrase